MSFLSMDNSTFDAIPSLPSYTLTLKPSLIPGISDLLLQLISPIIAYWVVSLFFQILDQFDLFAQYRLHTPAELLKRNHVSKYEVFRDVVIQQVIQTIFGLAMGHFDPPEMVGKDDYNVAVWAQRLRRAETHLPQVLALAGVNAPRLANQLYDSFPVAASALAGGKYAFAGFAPWEIAVAKAIYWVGVPFVQFTVAIMIVDTWQYFLHRAMHMNKFLYNWLHSRHHRLYVPYAFGALYNHPLEGFMLDTLGTGLAYLVTGMSIRQGLWFFTCSTIKTVDDHCGYAFPWDPLQHFTGNNASYHDIHHQSWGIKANFSQPFFTFWDGFLGTKWTGGDVSARYERAKQAAQRKVDSDNAPLTNSPAIDAEKAKEVANESRQQLAEAGIDDSQKILREELQEEKREQAEAPRSIFSTPRRRQSGFDPKIISDAVSGSLYGRRTPILHADGVH